MVTLSVKAKQNKKQVSNGFENRREKTKHFKDTERKQKYMGPEGYTWSSEIRER